MSHLRRSWVSIAGTAAVLALAACTSLTGPPISPSPTERAPPSARPQPAPTQPTRAPAVVYPSHGAQIALLLPLSGRQAGAAISVREGFMTAWYQAPTTERPRVRVYDTAEMSTSEAIMRATQDGAGMIVGPLTRDEVTAAADIAVPRPPLLALNYLPADRAGPQGFYQFALSPENEARAVARRMLARGQRHGIALVPTGDWGTRVLAAFTQELEAGGGTLLANAAYEPAATDFAPEITQVLRLSESRARAKRLESTLGAKLEFEPRRRGDIDFIFAPSQSSTARLMRPQLRFHYAGSIPTYATSEAFEPDPNANQDVDGLMFPDMPWMLGGALADAVHAAAREAWPSGGPRRNRLFAFGFDAYRLAVALRSPGATNLNLEGVTGQLTLDADRKVHRELAWAQLYHGEARPLPPIPN